MAINTHLREELTIILPTDDAIVDVNEYAAYQESGYDEGKLRLSGEPTRFRLRRMTYDQRKRADDITSAPERIEYILRCCLLDVKGLKTIHENGETSDVCSPTFEDGGSRGMVKLSWLRDTNLPPSVMAHLAALGKLMSECNIPFPVR